MFDRRQMVRMLGASLAGWPAGARSEPGTTPRFVGIAFSTGAGDVGSSINIAAFKQELAELGWQEGRDLRFGYAFAENSADRARTLAAEMVGQKPDVILTSGTIATVGFHQTTKTVPIIFANVTDPVAGGFVQSLSQPGGNITGFTPFDYDIAGKWLEQLRVAAPRVNRVAMLGDPANHNYRGFLGAFREAAAAVGVEALESPIRDGGDIERAMTALAAEPGGGLIVTAATFSIFYRAMIVERAAKERLPAIYWARVFPANGGLMSYGPNSEKLHRQAASYVDRILKGASPGNLPVQRAATYETVINLKAAKAIGVEVTPTLLALADEVIE